MSFVKATLLKSKLVNNAPKWALLGGITVGIGSFIMYTTKKLRQQKHPSIPTAPHFHPYTGHMLFWAKNWDKIHDALREVLLKQDSDMVSMNMPGSTLIFLLSPKIIKWTFTTEFDKFWKSAENSEFVADILGDYGKGIFVSDGKEWKLHRKIGSRMFSLRNLRDYMYKCCENTTDIALNKLDTLHKNKKIIDINDILGRMTFDCFTSLAFGVKFDSMSIYPKPHAFGKAFDSAFYEVFRRFYDPLWKLKKALKIGYEQVIYNDRKEINKFIKDVISTKNKANSKFLDETGKQTFDLFSLYKTHSPELTDHDLKFIALNFIIAGRDTTRMLLSWFFYDMSQYNDIKKKVINEIDNCNKIDFNKIKTGLKYLEATLCETLRYHPVVPLAQRTARRNIKIPKSVCGKEYLIRKGDRIAIHGPTVSRSTKFYKNPNKYDPLRFIKNGVSTYPPHIYPFFNQKPRLCLGRDFALMEAKIFVYSFFKKYDFELIKNQKIEYVNGAILNMKNGLKINIIPRI